MEMKSIRIRGAREHNLKDVSLEIPRDQLVVITGLSGSGKSSLAFDTIFAEGQRKYMESLSAYARQFLQQMQKPDCDEIEGLPPTIAIEQRGGGSNPRSTVATTTEIYDYMRVLFARTGKPHCWICAEPIAAQSPSQIVQNLMQWPENQRLMVISPLVRGQKGAQVEALEAMTRQGFVRARVDGQVMEIKSVPALDKKIKHTVEAVVDRLTIKPEIRTRLADSIELSLKLSDGLVVIAREESGKWVDHTFSSRYACPNHPESSLEELSPRLFSFNSPYGACSQCDGLGTILEFDEELIVPDKTAALLDGAIEPFSRNGKRMNIYYNRLLRKFCEAFGVDGDTPFEDIPVKIRQILLRGTTAKDAKAFGAEFEGVLPNLQRRWENTDSEFVKARLHDYLSEQACEKCHGDRLKPQALAVRIGKYNIREMTALTIGGAIELFDTLKFSGEHEIIAAPML